MLYALLGFIDNPLLEQEQEKNNKWIPDSSSLASGKTNKLEHLKAVIPECFYRGSISRSKTINRLQNPTNLLLLYKNAAFVLKR